ncbi:MAG: hypothetical protein EOP11_20600 [Proteobacteria bacterium]|nr:MAG: hypothetical protein EOP11_20600 [Pseudomonadota bacterium]
MKWLFIVSFLLVSGLAGAAERAPFELGVSPNLAFAGGGSRFSIGAFFKIPINDRWQIKLADDALVRAGGRHNFTAGVNYNFSDDWRSAYFAGAGVGYRPQPYPDYFAAKDQWLGYLEVGKRFTLVHSLGLNFAPQVQLSFADGANGPALEMKIMPANITWMF